MSLNHVPVFNWKFVLCFCIIIIIVSLNGHYHFFHVCACVCMCMHMRACMHACAKDWTRHLHWDMFPAYSLIFSFTYLWHGLSKFLRLSSNLGFFCSVFQSAGCTGVLLKTQLSLWKWSGKWVLLHYHSFLHTDLLSVKMVEWPNDIAVYSGKSHVARVEAAVGWNNIILKVCKCIYMHLRCRRHHA